MSDTTGTTGGTPGRDDDKVLAAELALRVLPADEEARARLRATTDPDFAAEVDVWNEHLTAFAAEVPPVEPSPAVWPRVLAGIGTAANDNDRTAFWRTWAVGSTGLLAASLVAVALLSTRPVPAPVVQNVPAGGVTRVATLALENGAPAITLAYDTVTGNLFIAPTQAMAGETGVPHLWLVKPEGGVQLVGAISGEGVSRQTLTALLASQAGTATAVAISLEAPGTTPAADKPDGPVVASGELQQL